MTERLQAADLASANAAFTRIFASANPFRPPFLPVVEKRALLYPLEGCELYAEQFEALVAAARQVGETEMFISSVELLKDPHDASQWDESRTHYRIDLNPEAYEEVMNSPLGLMRHAIYSVRSRWGLMVSEEMHALIGGPSAFVNALLGSLPPPIDLFRREGIEVDPSISPKMTSQEQMLRAWVLSWKELHMIGSRIDWLPALVGSIVGLEQANVLLDEIRP